MTWHELRWVTCDGCSAREEQGTLPEEWFTWRHAEGDWRHLCVACRADAKRVGIAWSVGPTS